MSFPNPTLLFASFLLFACQEGVNTPKTADNTVDLDNNGDASLEVEDIACDESTSSYPIEQDGDCDGIPTVDDCDDNDPNSTIVADDSDCDGCNDSDEILIGNIDIIDMDDFSCVKQVSGDVRIKESNLTNLDGLSNLTTIEGRLEIARNDSLLNTDGLSNLTTIGKGVNIQNNTSLLHLDGLSSLTTIGDDLDIFRNNSLTNIDGLSNLTSIGGDLDIARNDSLLNLDGLSSLTTIGGGFEIAHNDALSSIDGLSSLTTIGGRLRIFDNDALCLSEIEDFLSSFPDNPYLLGNYNDSC